MNQSTLRVENDENDVNDENNESGRGLRMMSMIEVGLPTMTMMRMMIL